MGVELLIATGNMHKAGEIQRILNGVHVSWRTTNDWPEQTSPEENGANYQDNARIKAEEWCRRTGLWTLADDSGLEVEALDGRPGLHSARYANGDEDPLNKLLNEMQNVEPKKRAARFVCAVVLYGPGGEVYSEHGYLRGAIAEECRGNEGFGFDPVFIPEGFEGKHLAELPSEVKNRISHRARALSKLRPSIEQILNKSL